MDGKYLGRIAGALDLLTAVAALGAAWLWLQSTGPLPPIVTYFDGAPPQDPFYHSLVESASYSRDAACCAAASALCTFASWAIKAPWLIFKE